MRTLQNMQIMGRDHLNAGGRVVLSLENVTAARSRHLPTNFS